MTLEVQATYEGGVLKPDKPLPLDEHERVTVHVQPHNSIRRSAGLVTAPTQPEALDHLLGPENQPWGSP